MTFDISSAANERVKRLVRLRDRKHRDSEGVFLVEGPRLFDRAIQSGLVPLEMYGDGSVTRAGPLITVHPDVLSRVSYRAKPEGLIAVFPQFETTLEEIRPSNEALLLVAENIEKPGNLGAVLRTAEAVGADAVVSVDGSVDRFNPNVLRASMGACFTVTTIETGIATLIAWLETNGVALICASPAAADTFWDADLSGPIALMVGSEAKGLSMAAREAATALVAIPMGAHGVDSLNTSVAMALLAYEAVRQRRDIEGPKRAGRRPSG